MATTAPCLRAAISTLPRIWKLPANVSSTSPIQVATAKDIETSGKIDVSDVLLQMPHFNNSFSDFNNRTSALTVAGGLSTADLRGLGPQRTLVLVNGRRFGAADANRANPNPAPDLDLIPAALIERIDVVTGGASATYGSDAIAGVINFTAAQYNSGSIPQGTGSQLSSLGGGNTALKPEKADTYSVGVTFTPVSVPGLSASIDYYQIKLTDEITSIPPALLLQQCLNTGDPFFCSKIVRNFANGGLTGSTIAGGGYFVQTELNIGAQTLDGIDVQGTYRQALPDGFGSVSFALNGALLLKSQTQSFPGGPSYNCAGLYGAICATVDPRWRHNLRTTWTLPRNVELAATWRLIGKVSLDNNDSNPQLYGHTYRNQNTGGPAFNYFDARIPNYRYVDLAATWQVYKGIEIRAGVNNVLDKDPPLVTSEITSSGANNTYETYDTLGRQLFVAFTAKF